MRNSVRCVGEAVLNLSLVYKPSATVAKAEPKASVIQSVSKGGEAWKITQVDVSFDTYILQREGQRKNKVLKKHNTSKTE